MNDWNRCDTRCNNSISTPLQADVLYYLTLGAAIVAGIVGGIAVCTGYNYWVYKSNQEDVLSHQQFLNPQVQKLQPKMSTDSQSLQKCISNMQQNTIYNDEEHLYYEINDQIYHSIAEDTNIYGAYDVMYSRSYVTGHEENIYESVN